MKSLAVTTKYVLPAILCIAALIVTVKLTGVKAHGSRTSGSTSASTALSAIGFPANKLVFLLSTDNVLVKANPSNNWSTQVTKVRNVSNGNLIGIDFRPADNLLYALTDTGDMYTISTSGTTFGQATKVTSLTTRFPGGFQSLYDFNPVVNALRIIGSDTSNYAAVNANGGSLNTTAVQTALTYAQGDVNQGKTPKVSAGSYNNNRNGATTTLFYAVDYDLDTFVTIADKNATGSSNTGGGRLQTIGSVVDSNGRKVNFTPTADIDIYTDANGVNTLVGTSGSILFTIDLSQIAANLQLGSTQNVTVKGVTIPILGLIPGGLLDIAIPTN